jgi:hypothetical protein
VTPAKVVESVVPSHERPEPTTTLFTALVPLPARMPPRVVEPVPPLATPTVPRVNAPVDALYVSGADAESEVEEILLLKVVKSADERYPLAAVVAWLIERTFPVIESGAVALVMRFAYALAHSVVEAVSGMVYPAVSEKTPVPEVYVRPVAVDESEVEEILLLKVVKSVDER